MRKISIQGRGKIDQAKDRLKRYSLVTAGPGPRPLRPDRRDEAPWHGSADWIRQWIESVNDPPKGRLDQLVRVWDEIELDGGQHAAVIGLGHSYGTSHAYRGWP